MRTFHRGGVLVATSNFALFLVCYVVFLIRLSDESTCTARLEDHYPLSKSSVLLVCSSPSEQPQLYINNHNPLHEKMHGCVMASHFDPARKRYETLLDCDYYLPATYECRCDLDSQPVGVIVKPPIT